MGVAGRVGGRRATPIVTTLVVGVASIGVPACSSNAAVPVDGPPREAGVEVGATYEYDLDTHCGVEWARLDGAWWRTDRLDDGNANPPAGWANPIERGRLTVVEPDVAVFEGGPGGPIEFVRTGFTLERDPDVLALAQCE